MNAASKVKITAILVDDEKLAIQGLELLLADFPHIHIVGTANTIKGAVRLIRKYSPDLIFLDIQLQGETGFDLFERTRIDARVVFVTAFDAYAVRAFEINALDYLQKPVSRDRLGVTLQRMENCTGAQKEFASGLSYDDVVVINAGRRMRFVKVDQILSITAEGDYTRVSILNSGYELVSKSMKAWENQLPSHQFARIHRSTILNMERIQKIEKTSSHRYLAHLKGHDTPFPMSQRYSAQLRKRGQAISKNGFWSKI